MTNETKWRPALTHGTTGMQARYVVEGVEGARGEFMGTHRAQGKEWVTLREGRRLDVYLAQWVEVAT